MVTPTHLRSFQALELAVRTGSLKSAAEVLAITPAAVGQRVKALEDYLEIELLVRGRSGLMATPALAGALDHLTAAFRELGVAADLLEMQRGQEIRIAAVSDLAEIWLAPRIGRFREAHPNVILSINGAGDGPVRIGAVDCQITFASVPEAEGGEVLFHDFLVPIGSPENTARIQKLPSRDQLEGFPLLHLDFYKDDPAALSWSDWILKAGLRRSAPERGIRFQRISQAVDAVQANVGLAICGLALLESTVEDKTLSLPFGFSQGRWTRRAFQARFRRDALTRAPVRRFRDWLLEESSATRAWLARVVDA